MIKTKTNAIRILESAGVRFTTHEYDQRRACRLTNGTRAGRLGAGNGRCVPGFRLIRMREVIAIDIFDVFRAAANPEKAAPMAAYMRGQFAYIGIPTPERKKLSRDFLKMADKKTVDWAFVFKCWDQPEREFQYVGVEYLLKHEPVMTPIDIPNIRRLIVTKSWWDTVDSLDVLVGGIALRYPEINDIVLSWSTDENIWLRRTAIDHQLTRKEKTDTALLERILVNNFGTTEFFINKAIGWSLRDYSKTNPDWVRDFISRHRGEMAALSVSEASKYI